jgi:hypothetical protein
MISTSGRRAKLAKLKMVDVLADTINVSVPMTTGIGDEAVLLKRMQRIYFGTTSRTSTWRKMALLLLLAGVLLISLQPGRLSSMTTSQEQSDQETDARTPHQGTPKLPPASPKRIFVTGTVVDGTTGAPIESYVLIPGYSYASGNRFFDRQKAERFDVPAFVFEVIPPNFAGDTKVVQELRIEANGYPAQIVELDTSKQPVTVEIKLHRDAGTTGVVQDSKGNPLPDAQIVVCLTSRWTQINDNKVLPSNSNTVVLHPNPNGLFIVSDADAAHSVLALHDTGYALVDLPSLKGTGKVVIKPWAALSGTFRVGDTPVQGVTIQLRFEPKFAGAAPNGNILVGYETQTDGGGRFSFDRIPAWPGTVGKQLILKRSRSGFTSTYQPSRHLIIKSGRDNNYDIGGTGRAVTGRFVAPKTYGKAIDFRHARGNMWLLQEDPRPPGMSQYERDEWYYQRILAKDPKVLNHWRNHHATGFLVEADGTFRVNDLPPGEYQLLCQVQHPDGESDVFGRHRHLAVYSSRFTVDDSRTSAAQALGDLELTIIDASR